MSYDKLIDTLRRHEGVEHKVYEDTMGIKTIGVGRNLESVGLSDEEIDYLLVNDIDRTKKLIDQYLPWWTNLNEVRQEALINFVFNVGIGTAQKFKNAMKHLEEGNYEESADEFLNSNWAKQVKGRAIEVTDMIRTGNRSLV